MGVFFTTKMSTKVTLPFLISFQNVPKKFDLHSAWYPSKSRVLKAGCKIWKIFDIQKNNWNSFATFTWIFGVPNTIKTPKFSSTKFLKTHGWKMENLLKNAKKCRDWISWKSYFWSPFTCIHDGKQELLCSKKRRVSTFSKINSLFLLINEWMNQLINCF